MQILRFEVAGVGCALPAAEVRQVLRAVAVAPLPGAPPVVAGVINLRGLAVPVLDLRRRFGLPGRALHPDDVFVVAEVAGRAVALWADVAVGLADVDPAAVEPASTVVARPGYVGGVARLPDGVAMIHDLATFLSDAESGELDAALAAGAGPAAP